MRNPDWRLWRRRAETPALLLLLALGCSRPVEERVRVVPQVSPLQPRRVQFAPTDAGRLLVMEASGLVGIWDVRDLKRPELFASMAASAIDARFAPDGRTVATVGIDGRVRWWGVDGRLLWTSTGGHDGMARTVAVSADGIVSGGEDGKLRLWTLAGAPVGVPLDAHQGGVMSVDVANGDLVSMGMDETARLWTRDGAAASYTPSVLYAEPNPRHVAWLPSLLKLDVQWGWDRAVAFSPRGDVIAGAVFDGTVRLWNRDGTPRATMVKAHDGHHLRGIAFAPGADVLATSGFDGTIRLWNTDGSPYGTGVPAHQGPALSVAFGRGDVVASAGIDEHVRFWRLDGSKLAELPIAYGDRIRDIAFSPRAAAFAAADATGLIRLWNLNASSYGQPLAGHRGPVMAVAFSPDGALLASAGKDTTVRVWRTAGGQRGQAFTGHVDGVVSVAFAMAGDRIASGSRNDSVRVWDLEARQLLALNGLRDLISSIVFAPTGNLFAAADAPGEIMVWNRDGSVHTNVFKAHQGYLHALTFSPDGQVLASAGADALVKLWKLDGSAHAAPLQGHAGPVRSVAFSPNGEHLASGGVDGTLRLWRLTTREARIAPIGLAIDELGFLGQTIWVRANGETLYFFDRTLQLRATMVLRRNAVLAFTPDGWLAGSDDPLRSVRLFNDAGAALAETDAAKRVAPDRILAAITGQ